MKYLICKVLFLFILVVSIKQVFAQNKIVDSLTLALKQAKHDSARVKILSDLTEECETEDIVLYAKPCIELCEKNAATAKTTALKSLYLKHQAIAISNLGYLAHQDNEIPKSLAYYNKAFKIAEGIKDKEVMANCLNNIGLVYNNQGKDSTALYYYEKALKLRSEIKDKDGLASSLNNIGYIYHDRGNIAKALDYYHQALKIDVEAKNKGGIASSLNNIGLVYSNQGDNEKALEYYNRALKIQEEINDKSGVANALNNIGAILDTKGDSRAMDYYQRALVLQKEVNDKEGVAIALSNIGFIYHNRGDIEKSLDYNEQSLKIKKEINDKNGISLSLIRIAEIMLEKGRTDKAYGYAKEGLQLANELGYPESIMAAAEVLKKIHKQKNNYQEALKMHELYIQMRDSISNEVTRKASVKKQFQIEYEKQSAKDSIANIVKIKEQQIIHNQAIKQQRAYTYGGLAGFALMLVVALVSFKAFKNKQKANLIITEQKQIAETQRQIIEEKQKEILDSIHYAQRIQSAILAKEEDIKKYFPESFLFYQPKDIIAGDFYFFESTETHVFYAAADCTGHGVPGALVSVVCSNALSRCVNEFELTEPGKILDKARELVADTFKKSGQDVKDGMDISLLVKNIKSNSYEWAGANSPLWYLQNGIIKEITANKQSIGLNENQQLFTTHTLSITNNDTVFLFTDGYADQFGGPKGKKFKYKNLEKLLLNHAHLSFAEQLKALHDTFTNWKGNMEQVDDICMIGIKI